MASAGFAIELPTNRQSRHYDGPAPNIHDPNYIPVLNGADPRVDFSQPSFSALPSFPTLHKDESQTSLKRSKSALAPETVVHVDHAALPLPSRPAATRHTTPQEIGSSHQSHDAGLPGNTGDIAATASDDSTAGTVAALEEHVFVIPGNSLPKAEEIQFPNVPASAQSSISSTRKSGVPTSRYNKKNSSAPSVPASMAPKVPSPLGSQGSSSEGAAFESARSTPQTSAQRLQTAKSTASERRARALHSHPSNVSLKSRRNSSHGEADDVPLISQPFPLESGASPARSRAQSICNSAPPTPAPDAPLPDLPAGVKRPATRERAADKPFPATPTPTSTPTVTTPRAPSPSTKTKNDHVELAEFMMTQKTTVFRRFDEVHVRLLLHLQDEISLLEKALKGIEDAGPGKAEHQARKVSIMHELRKVLAEYGKFVRAM